MTLRIEADPSGPVCRMRRPIVVSSGRMRSKVARSQPAKIEMLPVSARWQPPETGQSTGSPPSALTFAPSRRTSASSVVDISIQIFPSPIAESSPSSASSTAADAAGVGRQVMTASQDSIIRAGLSPQCAPASRNGWAASRSRSRTVRSSPLRSREPASLRPTLPSPMKPIFMCPFPVYLEPTPDAALGDSALVVEGLGEQPVLAAVLLDELLHLARGVAYLVLRQGRYNHTASIHDLNSQLMAMKEGHANEGITVCLVYGNPSWPAIPCNGGLIDIEEAVTTVGQHRPAPPAPDKSQILNERCRKRQEAVETCIDNCIDLPSPVSGALYPQRDDGFAIRSHVAGDHVPFAL